MCYIYRVCFRNIYIDMDLLEWPLDFNSPFCGLILFTVEFFSSFSMDLMERQAEQTLKAGEQAEGGFQ